MCLTGINRTRRLIAESAEEIRWTDAKKGIIAQR